MIQVSRISEKDYTLVSIDKDGYVTLLDETTCEIRSDIKLNDKSDINRQMAVKFSEGENQVKVTVLKALGEEQISAFQLLD